MAYLGGIESLWKWFPPGASEPAVTIGGDGPFRLLEVVGLGSLGVLESNADAVVGGIGENPRLSQRRGKSYALTGRIIASSVLELGDLEGELKAAFAEARTQGRMEIAHHPDNTELAGQTAKYFEAKPVSLDIVGRQSTKSFTRSFVIGLQAADPRVWDAELETHTVELTETGSEVDW